MMPFLPFFFHLYYVIVMPEPLNLLDNDSHIEKCWLLFFIVYLISSLSEIQRWSNQKSFYHFSIRNSI